MDKASSTTSVTEPRPNPNAKWVCGYQKSGLACAEGPTSQGRCCQVGKKLTGGLGDRRTPPANCDENCSCAAGCELSRLRRHPLLPSHHELGPCIPQRSEWFSRQTLALNAALLVGGVLLLCMALPQRETVFAPGGLSRKHSQILGNRLVSERCSLCHPNSHANVAGRVLQDELCMKCHSVHMPDAALRSPHDLTGEQIQSLFRASNRSTTTDMSTITGNETTSCAQCHREHHGEGFNLQAMSDASCQACHQVKFPSLSSGHPEFANYPYRKQRRLAFDHAAHANQHFAKKNETFACEKCHVDRQRFSELGPVFRSRGFDEACASCHDDAIRAATVTGWVLFQLPSIDVADTRESSLGLQHWPLSARFDYEGEISVPLQLLLAADDKAREALFSLPQSGRLQDIPTHSPARAQVSRSLAGAVARLVADVASQGQVAWKTRLEKTARSVLDRELTESERQLVERISAGLPPDLFRQMQNEWFRPQVNQNLASWLPLAPVSEASDSLLMDYLNKKGRLTFGPLRMASQMSPSQDLLLEEGHALVGDGDVLDNVWLEDNSFDDRLGGHAADDLFNGGLLADGLLGNSQTIEQSDSSKKSLTRAEQLRGSVHLAAGGWYLDNDLLALCYMPRGHADPTLAAWAEYMALLDSATQTSADNPPHRDVIHPIAPWPVKTPGASVPGSCTQCHLLEVSRSEIEPGLKWRSLAQPHTARPFTKFNHSPHLTLPALQDCRYCHVLTDRPSPTLASAQQKHAQLSPYDSLPEHQRASREFLNSEFRPIKLEQCSACHRAGGAKERCTLCHHYHVGASGLQWSRK